MTEAFIRKCLKPVITAEAALARRWLTVALLGVASVGLGAHAWYAYRVGQWPGTSLQIFLGVWMLTSALSFWVLSRRHTDWRKLATRIEARHPDLQAALLALMDQKSDPGTELNYLQRRLLNEVSAHAIRNRWASSMTRRGLRTVAACQVIVLIPLIAAAWAIISQMPTLQRSDRETATALTARPDLADGATDLAIAPGDVEIEKGERLVIEAIFSGDVPDEATLVWETATTSRRMTMRRGLDEREFSALIPQVEHSGSYHIDYRQQQSRAFSIDVFEHPAILEVNARVLPPPWKGGDPHEVKGTQNLTVLEGSTIEWNVRTNLPVTQAELFTVDGQSLPLVPSATDPTLLSASHQPLATEKYRIHLVDAAERGNKNPPWIQVTVRGNQTPDIQLTFPGQDYEVTAVQEIPIEASVIDDVEVLRTGFTLQHNGKEIDTILTEDPLPGEKKHALTQLVDLEALGAKPLDLITYYFWAEDHDSQGTVRRTTSDLFFSEVRYFDPVFTEGQDQGGGDSSGGGDASSQLLEIQKDIVNAAWKVQREQDMGKTVEAMSHQIQVISESQKVAHGQVEGVIQTATDDRLRRIYEEARTLMAETASAFEHLIPTGENAPVAPARQKALDTYAKLVEARARETQITRSRSQNSNQSNQQQQELSQLEMRENALRYEEQTKAQDASTPEQQENLKVLRELKDLASRQEAIAEKIKDLENQIAGADDEQRAEIERQLKRLEEEQRELVNDMDRLSQQMESSPSRSEMTEAREQLDRARDRAQQASEELAEQQLSGASNAATRASDELRSMEQTLKEETSEQFKQEIRSLREKARQLASQQKDASELLEQQLTPSHHDKPLNEKRLQAAQLAEQFSENIRQLEEIFTEMKSLSEASEVSEPLLADTLYEALRDATNQGLINALEETRDLTYYDQPVQARKAEQPASRGINTLAEQISKAADKLLGNEANALQLARAELDQLIEQARQEAETIAAAEGTSTAPDSSESAATNDSPTPSTPSTTPSAETGPEVAQPTAETGNSSTAENNETANKASPLAQTTQGELNDSTGSNPLQEGQPSASPNQASSHDTAQEPTTPATEGSRFFEQAGEETSEGIITGDGFRNWTDALHEIEAMMNTEELGHAVAQVMDASRAMRIEYRRNHSPPQADQINQRITAPLLEIRRQVSEELAKLNRDNPVAPIDREPVPTEFRDLVRRYYEQLGAGD